MTTYQKTTSVQRYSRETRMQNKLRKRTPLATSDSRSRSKDTTGSISKRNLKFRQNKSKEKLPPSVHNSKNMIGTNNVVVHNARNESVQRMFKNLNRTRAKLTSIRKQVDISGSKPNLKQEKATVNKSGNSQNNSYMSHKQKIVNKSNNQPVDDLEKMLFEKSITYKRNHNPKNMTEGQIMVNKTKAKKEPKTRIEMREPNKLNQEIEDFIISSKDVNKKKLTDYFESSHHGSFDEEQPADVPKIEVSLNEPSKKKSSQRVTKSKQTEKDNNSKRLRNNQPSRSNISSQQKINVGDTKSRSMKGTTEEVNATIEHNLGKGRDDNVGNKVEKTMPNTSKNIASPKNLSSNFKSSPASNKCESPSLSEKNVKGKAKRDISYSNDKGHVQKARKNKRAVKKASPIRDDQKNEIIKTISNKIKDSYFKNNLDGSNQHK